jgi:hypothetical protein
LTVRTAQRRGSTTRPSEDRIFQTDNAVIVLDGATQPIPLERSGGWYADQLGRALTNELEADPFVDLAHLLGRSIATIARRYDLVVRRLFRSVVKQPPGQGFRIPNHPDCMCDAPLVPGTAPSATIAILRWVDSTTARTRSRATITISPDWH